MVKVISKLNPEKEENEANLAGKWKWSKERIESKKEVGAEWKGKLETICSPNVEIQFI